MHINIIGVIALTNLPINPGIRDVLAARKFLEGKILRTPLEFSYPLSEMTGGEIWIKWECQQVYGSFKIRGALNKMNSLTPEERKRGVVTCSSGNHGQGVAHAAAQMGVKAVVFVPETCPETKKTAIKRYGGDWVTLMPKGRQYDDAEAAAHEFAEKNNITYISSFEDPWVIAGAGTVAFEVMTDEPTLDVLIIPAGGGGLINGCAVAAKALSPDIEIWGVQSEASNPWIVSWESGVVKEVEYKDSLADGLSGFIPQSLLSLAKTRMSGFIEVTEGDVAKAIAFYHREHHQVVEGAGAVGAAALLSGRFDARGRRVGLVVSGRNIDEARLLDVLKNN